MLEQRTGVKAWRLALQYWPFHQAVIQESGCKAVITYAIEIARHMARAFGLGEGLQRNSGWGGTLSKCYAWRLPEGPLLLAIPNLSRYKPDGPRQVALSTFFNEFVANRDLSIRHMLRPIIPPATSQPPPPAKVTPLHSEVRMGHICEQLVDSARYLEKAGMSGEQLSQIHHFWRSGRRVTFSVTYKYFGVNKELRENNIRFAERLKFVAEQHMLHGQRFSNLVQQAVKKYPL